MTPPGVFVVGTDTGVGKTEVAALLARTWTEAGRRVGVLKPISTGGVARDGVPRSPDADCLIRAIGGGDIPYHLAAPLVFEEPLAPAVAARRLGTPLDPSTIRDAVGRAVAGWAARAEALIVEGVGGLLCPIAEGWTVADLATWLDYPLLIVAHRGLGTLNHTLMTVEAAQGRGLRILGVVLNAAAATDDPLAEATNAAELARRIGPIPILADWPHRPGGDLGVFAPEVRGWYDRIERPRLDRPEAGAVGPPGGDLACPR